MDKNTENLKKFIQLSKNIQSIECIYDDFADYNLPNDAPDFFNLYLDLIENIEFCINPSELKDNQTIRYNKLITDLYGLIRRDAPQLYLIASNIEEILCEGFEAANNTIKDIMEPYQGKVRPFFLCGFASLEVFIRPVSFLGLLLQDAQLITLDNYKYLEGILILDLSNSRDKYKLTGQEYEIFSVAYKSALDIIQNKLKVNGHVRAFID